MMRLIQQRRCSLFHKVAQLVLHQKLKLLHVLFQFAHLVRVPVALSQEEPPFPHIFELRNNFAVRGPISNSSFS